MTHVLPEGPPRRGLRTKIRHKLYRFTCIKGKLSTRNLDRLCRDYATTEPTLVIHSEDVDYAPHFPNAHTVTKRRDVAADLHVDPHYIGLEAIPDASYPLVLCTGLLEHVPDPARLIGQMQRILAPGGRLVISASAVFSFHESPDNFFHFTPHGFRHLFRDWSRMEMLRGSSQPFETIGILLQRILLQCEVFPPLRPLIELLARTIRILDIFVYRQFDTVQFSDARSMTDTMLPSNIQACVVK
ncbi:class I SAM-dependent methyltransferase [Pseudooceanicola aestuarii]|uniref:class I SAM-dependent methyltransferase n=1 Tax=Pseudooceanicola aestuarii TaxID=2697319 RepID=UPI0013D38122|nr:methyltransferase domain-containing protein [Pseudooceanicola aestuarii]